MTYCEYIEQLLYKSAYLSNRLLRFHFSFGKQYFNALVKELKDIQTSKNN